VGGAIMQQVLGRAAVQTARRPYIHLPDDRVFARRWSACKRRSPRLRRRRKLSGGRVMTGSSSYSSSVV